MGRLLARAIMVPLGMLLGFIAGLIVLAVFGIEPFLKSLVPVGDGTVSGTLDTIDRVIDTVLRASVTATTLTVIPALVAIIAGEIMSIRSFTYYVVVCGLAAVAGPWITSGMAEGTEALPLAETWALLATAGFTGGAVYWLLAGRWA